jgi:integrase
MSEAHYGRRCACRDPEGKQYGARCPKLKNPRHGTWQVFVNVPATASVDRQRIRKGGFTSKADAELWAKPYLKAKLDGQRFIPSRVTLAAYWPDWIRQRSSGKRALKASTLAVYELYGREIIESPIAQMPLTDVRRSDVQRWIDELATRRGPQAVTKIATILKSVFSDLERREIIVGNPARLVDLPEGEAMHKRIWSPEQVTVFLKAAAESTMLELYELALHTGLRRGELCGLTWDAVDLKGRNLTVRLNRVQIATRAGDRPAVVEGTAKSAAGQGRIVGLGPRAVRALRQRKLRQNQDRLRAGQAWHVSDYVFTTQLGEPLMPEYPSRQLGRLAKAAGLPEATLHSLRHQHATALRETGSDGFLIAVRLGHAQASVTARYAHVSLSAQLDAAERAESYFPAALSSQRAELSTQSVDRAIGSMLLQARN